MNRPRIRQSSLMTVFSLSILMNVIFLESNYFYLGRWFGKFNYVGKKQVSICFCISKIWYVRLKVSVLLSPSLT
jgi:hypothetical protein